MAEQTAKALDQAVADFESAMAVFEANPTPQNAYAAFVVYQGLLEAGGPGDKDRRLQHVRRWQGCQPDGSLIRLGQYLTLVEQVDRLLPGWDLDAEQALRGIRLVERATDAFSFLTEVQQEEHADRTEEIWRVSERFILIRETLQVCARVFEAAVKQQTAVNLRQASQRLLEAKGLPEPLDAKRRTALAAVYERAEVLLMRRLEGKYGGPNAEELERLYALLVEFGTVIGRHDYDWARNDLVRREQLILLATVHIAAKRANDLEQLKAAYRQLLAAAHLLKPPQLREARGELIVAARRIRRNYKRLADRAGKLAARIRDGQGLDGLEDETV